VNLPIPTKREDYLTMHSFVTGALVRATRQLAGRYIWTHPSIAQTFSCRPTYQASFKKSWLSLMWGGEASTRRLRESIAVAISAANQCFY
jgi:hypothetical protein